MELESRTVSLAEEQGVGQDLPAVDPVETEKQGGNRLRTLSPELGPCFVTRLQLTVPKIAHPCPRSTVAPAWLPQNWILMSSDQHSRDSALFPDCPVLVSSLEAP